MCSHKWKIQNISDRIYILSPGSCSRGGTLGHWGYPEGQTFFFQTWSCSISNRRGWRAEQNASNIFILGSNWWPWGEVKRSNIINMSISKILIPNFVCVLTNKRSKTYWTEFSFCWQGHVPWWNCGVPGESKKFSVGICDGAHRLRTLVFFAHWPYLQHVFFFVIQVNPWSANHACSGLQILRHLS